MKSMELSRAREKMLREFLSGKERISESDLEDFARENRLPRRAFWYSLANILAEGTSCHDCVHVELRDTMYPCTNCVRGKNDYYEQAPKRKI